MNRPNGISESDYKAVVVSSIAAGVDPYLIFAIGFHETGWGTKGWGKHGYKLGIGCFSDTDADENFRGIDAQIRWATKAISEFLGFYVSYQGLKNFSKCVWKAQNSLVWATGVWKWYCRLVSAYAPEMDIAEEPPVWVHVSLSSLFLNGMINTPYGDRDFYRVCEIAHNLMLYNAKIRSAKDG